MPNKERWRKRIKEEIKRGDRDEKGRRKDPDGPRGRPRPELRCFYCGRKLGEFEPAPARTLLRLRLKCQCGRITRFEKVVSGRFVQAEPGEE